MTPRVPVVSRRPRGFSLVELLVVLVLIALLAASAGGMVTASLSGGDAQATAYRVAIVLRRARSRALVTGRPQAVFFDLDKRRFGVDAERAYRLPADLDVHLRTARSQRRGERIGTIRFLPDGSATGGRLVIDRGGRRWTIAVSWLTGGVELHEGP